MILNMLNMLNMLIIFVGVGAGRRSPSFIDHCLAVVLTVVATVVQGFV
jgi:hypothetical protein